MFRIEAVFFRAPGQLILTELTGITSVVPDLAILRDAVSPGITFGRALRLTDARSIRDHRTLRIDALE